jgi:hypothetical protein
MAPNVQILDVQQEEPGVGEPTDIREGSSHDKEDDSGPEKVTSAKHFSIKGTLRNAMP